MKRIEFTQSQIDAMVQMHDNGMLNKDIAKEFHVSQSTINRILVKTKVQSRHPSLSIDREKKAIELYEKYHNLRDVGKMIHMSPTTVRQIMINHGIHILNASECKQRCTIIDSYFDNIDSHRKAYYLGLLYADGSVSKTNNRVQISLQEQDGYILEQLKNDLQSNYKISVLPYHDKNPNWSNQHCLTITNTKIHDALVSHGVIPNKSLILEFPDDLREDLVSSFILGYMDGDGSISKNPKDKRCNLISTENFCKSVSKILKEKLNINTSIMYCHRKTNVSTRVMQIAGNHQVKKFLDWIYSSCDIYLLRKHKIYTDLYCA